MFNNEHSQLTGSEEELFTAARLLAVEMSKVERKTYWELKKGLNEDLLIALELGVPFTKNLAKL